MSTKSAELRSRLQRLTANLKSDPVTAKIFSPDGKHDPASPNNNSNHNAGERSPQPQPLNADLLRSENSSLLSGALPSTSIGTNRFAPNSSSSATDLSSGSGRAHRDPGSSPLGAAVAAAPAAASSPPKQQPTPRQSSVDSRPSIAERLAPKTDKQCVKDIVNKYLRARHERLAEDGSVPTSSRQQQHSRPSSNTSTGDARRRDGPPLSAAVATPVAAQPDVQAIRRQQQPPPSTPPSLPAPRPAHTSPEPVRPIPRRNNELNISLSGPPDALAHNRNTTSAFAPDDRQQQQQHLGVPAPSLPSAFGPKHPSTEDIMLSGGSAPMNVPHGSHALAFNINEYDDDAEDEDPPRRHSSQRSADDGGALTFDATNPDFSTPQAMSLNPGPAAAVRRGSGRSGATTPENAFLSVHGGVSGEFTPGTNSLLAQRAAAAAAGAPSLASQHHLHPATPSQYHPFAGGSLLPSAQLRSPHQAPVTINLASDDTIRLSSAMSWRHSHARLDALVLTIAHSIAHDEKVSKKHRF